MNSSTMIAYMDLLFANHCSMPAFVTIDYRIALSDLAISRGVASLAVASTRRARIGSFASAVVFRERHLLCLPLSAADAPPLSLLGALFAPSTSSAAFSLKFWQKMPNLPYWSITGRAGRLTLPVVERGGAETLKLAKCVG
jgi:hypothetical protein